MKEDLLLLARTLDTQVQYKYHVNHANCQPCPCLECHEKEEEEGSSVGGHVGDRQTDRRNVKIESSTQNDVIKKPSPAGHKLRVGEAAVLVSVVLLQNLQANNCHHSIFLLHHLP